MKTNEQDDIATPRAGGDVIWKGPSHVSPAEPADETSKTTSPEAQEGKRAGYDVDTKSATQNQTGGGQ